MSTLTAYDFGHLPRSGTIRVYATCDKVTPESASLGDIAEGGWVNATDDRSIQDARNHVSPVWECEVVDGALSFTRSHFVDVEDALSDLAATINSLRAYETEDGSTLSGTEGEPDYATGAEYLYSLHAHVKHLDAKVGYVEDDFDLLDAWSEAAWPEAFGVHMKPVNATPSDRECAGCEDDENAPHAAECNRKPQ